jgi:hypothetical protein
MRLQHCKRIETSAAWVQLVHFRLCHWYTHPANMDAVVMTHHQYIEANNCTAYGREQSIAPDSTDLPLVQQRSPLASPNQSCCCPCSNNKARRTCLTEHCPDIGKPCNLPMLHPTWRQGRRRPSLRQPRTYNTSCRNTCSKPSDHTDTRRRPMARTTLSLDRPASSPNLYCLQQRRRSS